MIQLSRETIKKNKETILELIQNVDDPQERISKEYLINYLQFESDFFFFFASSKYHLACEGGLAQHSLNVYHNMKMLVEQKGFSDYIDELSIIIVSLFHDFSKVNYYKLDYRNKKYYTPNGSKMDNLGQFDWVSVPYYTIKEKEERFVYGNHEQTSEYLARCFANLTLEESVAILHHMGGKSYDSVQIDISEVYNNYSLAALLHAADFIATYIDERNE